MAERAKVMECDVLVIGGGFAGTNAAIRAKEIAERVILVEKGRVGQSGNSPISGCFILCPTDNDDLDVWLKELVVRGEYMADQDWVQVLLSSQTKMLREIDKLGPVLEKDDKGRLNRFQGRAHVNTWIVNLDAYQTMQILRKKAEDTGVVIRDRTMITDLLTEDGSHPTRGRVAGAVGLDTRTAEPLTFKAKAVVMTSGSIGQMGGDMVGLSADAQSMGFRAGAEITGLEFARWFIDWILEKSTQSGHLNPWQALKIVFTNKNGDRFFDRYFTELKERARNQDIGAAFGKEILEGRGPIYADFRFATQADWEWVEQSAPSRHVIRAMKMVGIDLSKDRIRFDLTMGSMTTQSGGLRNNIYAESSVPGLYAAGAAGGYPTHGTYSVGGMNIASCFVMGTRAGEYAARYARQAPELLLHDDQVKSLQSAALRPLGLGKGITAKELKRRISEFLSPARGSFYTNDTIIKERLKGIKDFKLMLPEMRAENPHELIRANSVRDWLTCLELTLTGALERKETRGSLLRTDYPYRDDINWLKRIVQVSSDGNIVNKIVPIPMYRYPVTPDRFEKVPYGFAMPEI